MKFGHHLLSVEPSSVSKKHQTLQGKALDLTLPASKPAAPPARQIPVEIPDAAAGTHKLRKKIREFNIGDVLSVVKDSHGSAWKDETSRWKAANDCWYIYVQGIHESKNGQKSFDGLWLYSPADTMCALMKYPWANELFLSDNCTCSQSKIKEEEILDVVTVLWHSNPLEAGSKLFIRQTYLENERFVTLKETHKTCTHLKDRKQTRASVDLRRFPIGQTVLVAPSQKGRHGLEPYEIIRYIIEGKKHFVVLGRLQRRREIDGKGKPNELVYATFHT
jgi:DNA (cytosine-5)-methyltransferase 1